MQEGVGGGGSEIEGELWKARADAAPCAAPSAPPPGREMAGVVHLDLLEYAKEGDDEVEAVHAEPDGDEAGQDELMTTWYVLRGVLL